MNSTSKFDGMDYMNTFAKRISVMHELVKSILPGIIRKGDSIIDIGGGPGIGARLIDELGIEATVTNIEPSTTIDDVPRLSSVKYMPLKMPFKDALDASMPSTADCLLMISAEHEIALCYGSTPQENKRIFFRDMDRFIRKNLRQNGSLIIGFPNYLEGASGAEIKRQRRFTESLVGHSHPPEEFFTLEEFSAAFGEQPAVYIRKPMTLAGERPEETILRANVAVFRIKS